MMWWILLGILVALTASLIYLGFFLWQLHKAGGPRALQAEIRRRLAR